MPTSQQIQEQYTELTGLLDLPDLSGSVVDRVQQLLIQLRDAREAKQGAEQDVKMMNWLDRNIHSQQMDDFDRKHYPNSWQWMIWAPKDVQGSARLIVGAAMARDEE